MSITYDKDFSKKYVLHYWFDSEGDTHYYTWDGIVKIKQLSAAFFGVPPDKVTACFLRIRRFSDVESLLGEHIKIKHIIKICVAIIKL